MSRSSRRDWAGSAASGRARPIVVGVLAFAVLAASVVAIVWWALFVRAAVDVPPGISVQVEIPKGATTADIAHQLAREGVVANANRLRLESRSRGADGHLKAGVYDLETGMGYGEVVVRLVAGPPIKYVTVTIPEGFTAEQVATRFARATGIAEDEILKLVKTGAGSMDRPYLRRAHEGSLEGYLFPKTYRVKEGSKAADVVGMMLDQFEKEIAEVDLDFAKSRGLDLHDLVTLASLVEREAKVAKERALVSSVIYNRLERRMRLEIDATIEYVLPGNRFRLLERHLRIDSPYNTYMYPGLPPGAIANPGLAALKAAAAPADTDFIYYVLTGTDGSHTFARTSEEFRAAKQKSKEVFGR